MSAVNFNQFLRQYGDRLQTKHTATNQRLKAEGKEEISYIDFAKKIYAVANHAIQQGISGEQALRLFQRSLESPSILSAAQAPQIPTPTTQSPASVPTPTSKEELLSRYIKENSATLNDELERVNRQLKRLSQKPFDLESYARQKFERSQQAQQSLAPLKQEGTSPFRLAILTTPLDKLSAAIKTTLETYHEAENKLRKKTNTRLLTLNEYVIHLRGVYLKEIQRTQEMYQREYNMEKLPNGMEFDESTRRYFDRVISKTCGF